MNLRKVIVFGMAVFIIYYFVASPGGAADVFRSAWHGLENVGQSLSGFVNSL